MTQHPEPGQHPSAQGPGANYGPPPPRHPHQPPRPPQPGPAGPPPPPPGRASGAFPAPERFQPAAPPPAEKGLIGALFDANFDYLVTPKLVKVFYILALMLITLSALMVVGAGIWISQLRNGWLVGLLVMCAGPVVWLFEMLLARLFLEAVVVRFKIAEYLRVIKDKI
ncbi:hypothetical protein BTM25_37080 [Actinomadura rubteroloni]|uniref:DUF4282 domain-containing protein n=1 Tax=Actinomadura rubteroloni TaxID=1926885 RepID=A0A2P4UJ58_9ACTN|nr:DUF4282 domain-containing protein [Actinomadura rubteroloni]POM25066.1 hypothetical protein BTM25_37080 [Actinomadura rubteroloni]